MTTLELLTCAHVVEQALPQPSEISGSLQPVVSVDFPFAAGHVRSRAQVLLMGDRDAGLDIARLRLADGPPPAGVAPVSLCVGDNMWNHACRTFGFPGGLSDGIWSEGVLKGREANGWIQFDGRGDRGTFITYGFSGCPVWNDQFRGVVGMVTEKLEGYATNSAFMIPSSMLLLAWGEYPMVWCPQQSAGTKATWCAYDQASGSYRWATYDEYGRPTWI